MQRMHRFGISVHQKSFCGRAPPEPAGELTARKEKGGSEGRLDSQGLTEMTPLLHESEFDDIGLQEQNLSSISQFRHFGFLCICFKQ